MTTTKSNTRCKTAARTSVLILTALLVCACGAKAPNKQSGATTPSPTEETVINGRA